jgi:hypothetical protein
MEILVWCRIVLSPMLIGLIIGGIVYLKMNNVYGLILGGTILIASLLIGIRMANSFKRMQRDLHPDADQIKKEH